MIALILLTISLTSANGLSIESCYKDGLCLGHLIHVQESVPDHEFTSIADCVTECKVIEDCKFVSFNSKHKTCTFSKACHKVVLTGSDYQHADVNCHHKIFIFGGWDEPPEPSIEILSLEMDITCQLPDAFSGNRFSAIHGFVNDSLTICGGFEEGSFIDSCQKYEPSLNTFTPSGNLQTGVARAAFAQWQNKSIIVAGGFNRTGNNTNIVQVVDETKMWQMPYFPLGHCMTPFNGKYIIAGGDDNDDLIYKVTYEIHPTDDGKKFRLIIMPVFAETYFCEQVT